MRKTWDTIKTILNRSSSKKQLPKYFKLQGEIINNEKEIANKFNQFFVNIGPNLASDIDNQNKLPFQTYLGDKVNSKFKFSKIDEATTAKIIAKMKSKNSAGFDNISAKLLKKCATLLIAPITALINQSLVKGIFPDLLKIAKVIPIYKKGDKHVFDNY